MSRHRVSKVAGVALATVLTVGLLPTVAGAHDDTDGTNTDTTTIVRRWFSQRPSLQAWLARTSPRARAGAVAHADGVSASVVNLSAPDPAGDSSPKSDITAVGARLTTNTLRLTMTVPQATNPTFDPKWYGDRTFALWAIDAGANGTVDKVATIFPADGGFYGVVVGNTAHPNVLCAGNAAFDSGGYISIQVPSACVGSPSQIKFGAVFQYDWDETTPSHEDQAPEGDDLFGPITSANTVASSSGGYVLDAIGDLRRVNIGGVAPNSVWYEYGSMQSPRGFATTPDGGHGYVLAGSGRLFGVSFGRNLLPPRVYGAKSWPGQNVARGVAIRPNGGAGLVVDRFGNLYPFSIGSKKVVPQLLGVPKWPGVDMARGVAVLPNGQGGFTLDAFGGLNWFSIGAARTAPTVIGRPVFAGDDARGVAILADGTGGFIIDKGGALHFFSIGTARAAPSVTGGPSWPFQDQARGVGVLTRLILRP